SANFSIPRLGIMGTGHIEGLHGIALGGPHHWGGRHAIATTQFPQAYGLAETWDTAIMQLAGSVEGYEARYIFQSDSLKVVPPSTDNSRGLVIRAPNADLGRDPRWGRMEECYGEDPFFNGTMATAFIRGLQGDDPHYWQAASLMKHFLANSYEDERSHFSANVDERLLREYYMVPFRMGVEQGGSRAYMAAYNAVNGVPMMVSPLLRQVTADEWGQNGIICSDGGALNNLIAAHHYYPDKVWGAAASVKAGINQFLPSRLHIAPYIDSALKEGLLSEADIDSAIKGDFRVMIKLGLLDPPSMVSYTRIKNGPLPWLSDRHKAAVLKATRESIVLLKNKNHLLPLDKRKIRNIAVIGSKADVVLEDMYSGTPPFSVTPVEGIEKEAASRITVRYAVTNGGDSAVNLAKWADIVIMCVGNDPTCHTPPGKKCPDISEGKEAVDRESLKLTEEQLIRKIYRVNPNMVVVLISSFPYSIVWTEHNVPAILHMTQGSEELGQALADVLFGAYDPGGRLVQTWPVSLDELPPIKDYDIRDGSTYMYFKYKPLYPFGYGLSYTTFQFSHLSTSTEKMKGGGSLTVSLDVTNTGDRAGDEVVQLYVKHLDSKVSRPAKELKGFARVFLKKGQTRRISIPLHARQLSYWDADRQRWMLEKEPVRLMVGVSSEKIMLGKTIEIQ
ncbi:MAG TPA: glycoside hydrolase family 3 C-terminal domain-containing protein, partial [Chitinophagaceae bacterium]|nr:glycoside hydrolase family 3 C-terminal domain-containing protein [Chitinophagaceae bacterium]